MSSHQGFESRIKRCYERMTPAERRLADLLLGFPGNPVGYSATELAELAGVSKAVTSKLFRKLGYRGFDEFRNELRSARQWGSPIYRSQAEPTALGTLNPHIRQELSNIEQTMRRIDERRLAEAVEALRAARRLTVCGFRNSYMLASYLVRQLMLVRSAVDLIPLAGQTLGDDLVDLGADDLLVMIGLRRRVPQTHAIMRAAHDRGVPILYVTDRSARRTAALATWVLEVEVESISPFDSYTSAMSLLNLLVAQVFGRDLVAGYGRLRRIEAVHDTLDELDTTAWLGGER